MIHQYEKTLSVSSKFADERKGKKKVASKGVYFDLKFPYTKKDSFILPNPAEHMSAVLDTEISKFRRKFNADDEQEAWAEAAKWGLGIFIFVFKKCFGPSLFAL